MVERGNNGKLIMTHHLIILRHSEDTRIVKKREEKFKGLRLVVVVY